MVGKDRVDADVVVVGGGHNGLAAAAYLGRAGYAVTVLEQGLHVGGAAVSAQAFPGRDARLSRYSYLVSLLPQTIRDDLDLPISLIRRRFSSYTPVPGSDQGLLIDAEDPERTRASFEAIGAADDYPRWVDFYRDTEVLAATVFPTMTDPLLTESEMRTLLEAAAPGRELYRRFVETPITELIDQSFQSDIVRGVVLTDALIGTFPQSDSDPGPNVCFWYHVIGGGTGDWDVPLGGMGAVSSALERSALDAGVTILTGCPVSAIHDDATVDYEHDGVTRQLRARLVISGVARHTLNQLTGHPDSSDPIEGAQVKVNLLLRRLPALRDSSVLPHEAFGGTFHVNESAQQLAHSIAQAQSGAIPETIPCEIYCHSLSDRSILGEGLHDTGAHTLTIFALNVPHRLVTSRDPDAIRGELQRRVLDSLNSVLAEPIEDCVLEDTNGELCIETKTTQDLEDALGLPGGNIFHEPLSWPFVPDGTPMSQPAQRWGVDSGHPHILLAGSSARRGGGVSAIGGHNAAMAALEMLGSV